MTADDMCLLLSAILMFGEGHFDYGAIDPEKAHGLAALRVGYALASDASPTSLMDRECISQITQERARVAGKLRDLAPSLANFRFFHAREDASELAKRLFPYGVIVKPWREPGFTERVRVSIGSPKHEDQFLAALEQAAQPK